MTEQLAETLLKKEKVGIDDVHAVGFEAKKDGKVTDAEAGHIIAVRDKAMSQAKTDFEKATISSAASGYLTMSQVLQLLKQDALKWMTALIVMAFFAVLAIAQANIK